MFSHKNDFLLNQREIEPFEPPKILGDIFESVLGAVFTDGGMDAVYKVYRDLLSPLILFVAKFSKQAFGEPKEQMVIQCGMYYKLRPKFVSLKEDPVSTTVKNNKCQSTQALMYTC
jgi:dsRNA-specific ribonuclease